MVQQLERQDFPGPDRVALEIELDQFDPNELALGVDLRVSCLTPRGLKSANAWSTRVDLRQPGPIRRDLFIEDLPRQLVATQCRLPLFVSPGPPDQPIHGPVH